MKRLTKYGSLLLLAMLGANIACAGQLENWTKNCASCHGKDGAGKTKAGKMADVKDFTDAKYQESFTDEHALKQVKEGLKDKNGKDRMKAYATVLNDAEIKELVAYIRTLKK